MLAPTYIQNDLERATFTLPASLISLGLQSGMEKQVKMISSESVLARQINSIGRGMFLNSEYYCVYLVH